MIVGGMISPATAAYLLALARSRLAQALGVTAPPVPPRPDDPVLDRGARLFVTWKHGERLVGCLGQLEPTASLEATVARLAVQAGCHDPRTGGARPDEFDALDLEISILSEPRVLDAVGLPAIARRLRPGRDGLLLEAGGRHAFFLPQVWHQLPEPAQFLAALVRKGAMDPILARRAARGQVFEAQVLHDPAPARASA